jgi:hypothetical protein
MSYQNIPGMDYMNYQDTDYNCGPASLSMVGASRGYTQDGWNWGSIDEGWLANLAWTNENGTSHAGLKRAAHDNFLYKLGNYAEYNWSDLANLPVVQNNNGERYIIHLMTGPLPGWYGNYGHYVALKGVDWDNRYVRILDPTKGVVDHSFDDMARACGQISQNSILQFKP